MAHRIIFTNTPKVNYSLTQKYVVGSGVGSRNRSVRRALQRRASNDSHGKPCCIPTTNIDIVDQQPEVILLNIVNLAIVNEPNNYTLIADTIIAANEQLTIDPFTLFLGEHTLINNGTIIISSKNGGGLVDGELIIDNNFTNNGTIIVKQDPGVLRITGAGILTNTGTLTNENIFTI